MGESFAHLLKRHRIAVGLSQEKLAERAGVSVDEISALERGVRHAPYKATLDLLIAALALDDDARSEIEEAAKLARALAQRREVLRNLPLQLTSFVNREKVLAEIKELLQSHRLVTLTGTGGAGKTRSAIKVASEMLDEFDDGVWLAELAPISDPALVVGCIARALSLQESPNRPILDVLLAYLKRKHLLLVLDNCEHVIEEASHVVAAILQVSPDVRILATSRESLAVAGEQVYLIPSLAVPSTSEFLSTDELLQYGAVQLFTDRALSADNGFTLSVDSAPHIAEICRRLDGIPLAIELAASRVNVLSPKQLAQKLDERMRLLTAADRSTLPRHRTMRALIDWSYDLLSDDERRLFRKISIFASDFPLEMVVAVCSDETIDEIVAIDLLSSLVEKSLVQTEQAETARRYRLLESTREYAREKLVEAGEYETVVRAHATAFLMLAEELDRMWETTPERLWLAQAEPELESFRAALSWALGERGDVLLGQRLAGALRAPWGYLGPAEGWRWVQSAIDLVDAQTPASVVAALDFAEAELATTLSLHKVSRAAGERAVTRYRRLGDPLRVAKAQRLVGQAFVFSGEVARGEVLLSQALTEARKLGLRRLAGISLEGLASARLLLGDVAGARPLFAEALSNYRAAGLERAGAWIGLNLAEGEFQAGNAAEALRLAGEALAASRALNDLRNVAVALCNTAAYLTALERYEEGRIAARAALSAARDVQYDVCAAWGLQHLAAIAALRPPDDVERSSDPLRAARLLGYVDARLSALASPRDYTEQQERDKMLVALRGALSEDPVAKLMADGSTWSEDRAVTEAMLI